MWPVVWPMSEPSEFEFVSMKIAVRDSVAQIGNHTSKLGQQPHFKSETSIQSAKVLNAWENGQFLDRSIVSPS